MNEIATSFSRVFWGLLLGILHIRLGYFDILPAFVGYILVAVGLGGLTGLSARFATARVWTWVLVPISLVALFVRGDVGYVIVPIYSALDCAMI